MSKRASSVLFVAVVAFIAATRADAGIQSRADGDVISPLLRPMATGTRVQLRHIPVGDALDASLDLERFEVWAPNAELVVEHDGGQRTHIAPPPVQYFRGTVSGDPESMVFLAVRSDGATEGLVISKERRFTVRSRSPKDIVVEDVAATDDYTPGGGFMCDLDGAPVSLKGGTLPSVRSLVSGIDPQTNGTLSATGTWTLNLAIETDNELYVDFSSNPTTVATFIGNVVGAASTIYKRDLQTDLLITFSRIQATASDPWTINPGSTGTWNGSSTTYTTSHALAELGDVWANSGTRPYNGPRSSVVLMSGKSQTAGVAWIGASCTADSLCSGAGCGIFNGHYSGGFAYIGLGNPSATVPNPDATVNGVPYGLPSTNYWPVLGFAHELGHNVGSQHTHCVALTADQKTAYNVTRSYIDECYAGEGGCYGGATSVPPEKGTIMSYCHLTFSGGFPQSRFLFGKAGEPSELIQQAIKSYINSRTPASPAISAPASVASGASGNASINSPVAGLTYDWTITNGTINGSTQGSSINFTATTNPVTLRVRGTNTSGCSASDSVNVTVTAACTPPSITSVNANVVITSGTTVELNATATGTGPITYQWYVGESGDVSTPAAVGNPINATPLSTTAYWVRASNACGSADSRTVRLGVVDPPTTSALLYIVTPCRLIDTRGPAGPHGGPAIANLGTRDVAVAGSCGIPADAKAVVANITAVAPATTGFLAFYPTGSTWPGNSTMNYRTGKTRANNATLVLSAAGSVTVLNNGSTQNFIVDVTGYYK
ncbi:MAG: hypothetical protein JO197_23495 [Acidobacteria bacterium]|nr:hypothetical protein [Acidobacteriota bacterium]MBV9477826.1 hypothetical protein [Acidobacteriota bacterium]